MAAPVEFVTSHGTIRLRGQHQARAGGQFSQVMDLAGCSCHLHTTLRMVSREFSLLYPQLFTPLPGEVVKKVLLSLTLASLATLDKSLNGSRACA